MKNIITIILLLTLASCSSTTHIRHYKKKYPGVKISKVKIPDKFFYYSQPKLDMK